MSEQMEVVDVTDLVPVVEEPEISGFIDMPRELAREEEQPPECYPWSLPNWQQVRNMKENWIRAFNWSDEYQHRMRNDVETSPWFASVVENLRAQPSLESYEFEMKTELLGFHPKSGLRMTSFDAAILMGDLKMVQKIPSTGYHLNSGGIIRRSVPLDMVTDTLRDHLISESPQETGLLYTPLHLAVATGDSHIIDEVLDKSFASLVYSDRDSKSLTHKKVVNMNVENWLHQTPLDLAWKLRNVTVLRQLLQRDAQKRGCFHVVVRHGDIGCSSDHTACLNSNAVNYMGRTPLHYLATIHPRHDVRTIVDQIRDWKLDVTAQDHHGLSAFYVAVLFCNTKLVTALLDYYKDKVRLNEECDEDRGPPIQIACEGGHCFKDIERALMECEPVKGYMDKLYRDRQVYVDAANAILVGAALIASVTFASWLQPPLNYTSYIGEGYSSSVPTPSTSGLSYVDVEHNIALRAFWVFNALSFYFAIATDVCGARSVLPRSHLFIKKTMEKLRTNLLVTSILLASSVLFVIIAFAIAGTIVLTPLVKYRWCMIVPTLVGGMVCIISLGFLVKSMREIYSDTRDNSEGLNHKDKVYLWERGYLKPSLF